MAPVVKNLPANAGDIRDVGSVPGLGRFPGGGHGNPPQYSCLKNPMDREAWRATVQTVAKNWTWLKRLSTHASKCQSTKVFGHDLVTKQHTAMRRYTDRLSVLAACLGQSVVRWERRKHHNIVHLTLQEQRWRHTAPTKTSLFIQRDVTGPWMLLIEDYFMWSFSDNILIYITAFNKFYHLVSKPRANQSSKLRRKKGFSQHTESKERENYF